MGYYEDYIGTIEIHMLDRQMRRIYGVKIKEAYPVNRSNINLSQNSLDTLSELPVSFIYADVSYSVNNVLYPATLTTAWDSINRVYDELYHSPFAGIDLSGVTDYLSKFGSSSGIIDTNISQPITSAISGGISEISKFANTEIKKLTDKYTSQLGSGNVQKLISPYTSKLGSFGSSIDSKIVEITSGLTSKYTDIFDKGVTRITSPFTSSFSGISKTISNIFKF